MIKMYVEQNANSNQVTDSLGRNFTKESLGYHYGEIPQAVMPDGENLDIFLLSDKSKDLKGQTLEPFCILGFIYYVDDKDIFDPKVLAVESKDLCLYEKHDQFIETILLHYQTKYPNAVFVKDSNLSFLQVNLRKNF